MEILDYKPQSSILFVFIGSNHKNTDCGSAIYDETQAISSYLSPHIGTFLKQVRNEVRISLDSVIWQNKRASELKMNQNLRQGRDFGGEDPRARYLPSITRFTGRFFNEGGIGAEGRESLLKSGHHALIIDGLHGVTTPTEPMQLFNCPLEVESLNIQNRWRNQDALTSVVRDYIEKNSIQRVFDLTARRFYRDLIDWYDLKQAGVDVLHTFFQEYAGNEAIPEFARICREQLFISSEDDLLALEPGSVYDLSNGNYTFSRMNHPPAGWAIEPLELSSYDSQHQDPDSLNLKLDGMVDIFERDMRNLIDKELVQKEKKWLLHINNENLKIDLEGRVEQYLLKYPMLSEDDINYLDFCTIRNYQKIITGFWSDTFEPIFRSRTELSKHFENINELRNVLKHNRGVHESTQKLGEGSLIWFDGIFRKYAIGD